MRGGQSQVKSDTNFEAAGLKFALLSFVHFDLDGHGAKNVIVAERKRTLVSKRHCGTHATGLCEACMHSAVDEKLIQWLYNCSTFLPISGHFLRFLQVTTEGGRRYMDTLAGNMSPNSEAEEMCRQEIRDCSISNRNAFDEATIHTDVWISDEEHEPLAHRHGEEAEAEIMLRKRKQWRRKRYVEIWDQFVEFVPGPLWRQRSRIGPHVHNSPSCCPGLDTQQHGHEPAN